MSRRLIDGVWRPACNFGFVGVESYVGFVALLREFVGIWWGCEHWSLSQLLGSPGFARWSALALCA